MTQVEHEEKPAISVLMPAYNTEKYIATAIESILNQTFSNFELIIIDDCSKDKTWEIIKEYEKRDERLRSYKNDQNLKISKTLNKAISLAKGKYLVRMDADDWSYPDRLHKQFLFMEMNENIVISGSSIDICTEELVEKNKRNYHLNDKVIRSKIFRYSPFCHPSIICKKDAMLYIGGYDVNLYDAEDYDMYFRIGKLGEFANLSEILLKLRTSPSSVSQRNARRQEKLTLQIRKKAVKEYGYKMSFFDKVYYALQFISMYIIPQKYKFHIFNYFRK
jgi:glycosyltransferase involved in cell wall biosynthesis